MRTKTVPTSVAVVEGVAAEEATLAIVRAMCRSRRPKVLTATFPVSRSGAPRVDVVVQMAGETQDGGPGSGGTEMVGGEVGAGEETTQKGTGWLMDGRGRRRKSWTKRWRITGVVGPLLRTGPLQHLRPRLLHLRMALWQMMTST